MIKRSSDPAAEDHTLERAIDWKLAAPRWVLVGLLVSSVGINGLFGSVIVGLIVERFNTIEKANSDPKWADVAKLATVVASLATKVDQHDADLKRIAILDARMADMQGDLKVLNNRLERKGF